MPNFLLRLLFFGYIERTHEICDNSRREMNKDNDKHDNRYYGKIILTYVSLYILMM